MWCTWGCEGRRGCSSCAACSLQAWATCCCVEGGRGACGRCWCPCCCWRWPCCCCCSCCGVVKGGDTCCSSGAPGAGGVLADSEGSCWGKCRGSCGPAAPTASAAASSWCCGMAMAAATACWAASSQARGGATPKRSAHCGRGGQEREGRLMHSPGQRVVEGSAAGCCHLPVATPCTMQNVPGPPQQSHAQHTHTHTHTHTHNPMVPKIH